MKRADDSLTEKLLQSARNNFVNFLELKDENYEAKWFHEQIGYKLQECFHKLEKGISTRLVIEMPPQHGKSQEATINFPAWVLGHHPEWPIITASYTSDLAVKFGYKTREIMASPIYQTLFKTKVREDSRAKGNWMTDEGGGYMARGIGGSTTGSGFKIGIIDDPFKDRREAESKLIRDNVWDWYSSVFMTRQQGPTMIVVINTRWHKDDLVGRIEELESKSSENYDVWEYLSFPAIAEEDEKYRKKGEALWPEKFPISFLEAAKKRSIYDFASLYQQHPIVSESQELKEEWIKRSTNFPRYCRKFATIDPAFKKTDENDYTGVCKNYVDRENFWYISAARYKINSKDCIDLIFRLHDEGFEKIGIEQGAYQITIKPFLDEECRKRNKFPNVVELKHKGNSKELRIRALVPKYYAGQIYHLDGQCLDLEEEYLSFPKGSHDDVIDALAYQIDVAEPPDMESNEYMSTFEIKQPGKVW